MLLEKIIQNFLLLLSSEMLYKVDVQDLIVDPGVAELPRIASEESIGRLEDKLSGGVEEDPGALHWIEEEGLDGVVMSKDTEDDEGESSQAVMTRMMGRKKAILTIWLKKALLNEMGLRSAGSFPSRDSLLSKT